MLKLMPVNCEQLSIFCRKSRKWRILHWVKKRFYFQSEKTLMTTLKDFAFENVTKKIWKNSGFENGRKIRHNLNKPTSGWPEWVSIILSAASMTCQIFSGLENNLNTWRVWSCLICYDLTLIISLNDVI